MHYGTKVFNDLLPIDEFIEKFREDYPEKNVAADRKESKVTLNKDDSRPRPLLIQLNYEPMKEKEKD